MAERLVVVFRVTTRCSLSCGFCAYDRRLAIPRHDADERVADDLATMLRAELRVRPVHVSFLGGEPLLWGLLPQVARRFSVHGFSLGITSNGAQLDSEAVRTLLLEHFDELTVSIDGLGDTHDVLRGWPGGFARLQSSLRWLSQAKALRQKPLLLRVNTVLMADNVRQLPELCDALASWGVEELTFNRLGGRDRPQFHAVHRLSPADVAWLTAVLPGLRAESAARGLRISGSQRYVRRLSEIEAGHRAPTTDCDPGRDFLFVDEHGQVAPCHFTLEDYAQALPAGLPLLVARYRELQVSGRAAACEDCQCTRVFRKFGAEHGS